MSVIFELGYALGITKAADADSSRWRWPGMMIGGALGAGLPLFLMDQRRGESAADFMRRERINHILGGLMGGAAGFSAGHLGGPRIEQFVAESPQLSGLLGKASQISAPLQMPTMRVMGSNPQMLNNIAPGQTLFGKSGPGQAMPTAASSPAVNQAPTGNLQQPVSRPPDIGNALARQASYKEAGGYTGGDTSSPADGDNYYGEKPQGSPLPSTQFNADSFQRKPVTIKSTKGDGDKILGSQRRKLYPDLHGS